jgi:RimJ/RimL family protein N-acetyltransferase
MSDQPVRIAKPQDLTAAEFDSVVALISEGGEVETRHLAERLKLAHRIALKFCEEQLACVGAIKAARSDYIRTISRKSQYPLDKENCQGEFGYVVTRQAFRRRGLARELSAALLNGIEASVFATTRDDNPAVHRIARENAFLEVGEKWRSVEHPNSMIMLCSENNFVWLSRVAGPLQSPASALAPRALVPARKG